MSIGIFYHVYQINNWREIYNEDIDILLNSKILEQSEFLHLSVSGKEDVNIPEKFKNKVIITRNHTGYFTFSTLAKLHKFSSTHEDYKIFYFYNKAVTHFNRPTYDVKRDWARYMLYYGIEKWEAAISALDNYNMYGVDLLFVEGFFNNILHYSGDFWWARSDYIRQLPSINFKETNRFFAEQWPTSLRWEHTYCCAHQSKRFLHDGPRFIKGIHYE